MHNPLLVSMLNRLADGDQQLQAFAQRESRLVAKLVQRQTMNQFHHKEWLVAVRHSGIQNSGDIGVIHQRQRLALLLEPSQHGFGIHPGLNELQSNPPFHRFGLLSNPHLSHSAFANFFPQNVAIRYNFSRL